MLLNLNINLKILIISFTYIFVIFLITQLFLYPLFINSNLFNNNLIFPDSNTTHIAAIKVINSLNQKNLSPIDFNEFIALVKEALPHNHSAIVYIVSTIYFYTYPHIIFFVILNSFIHGLSAIFLYKILFLISQNRKNSFIAILPFIFFPTSFYWNLELLKDGYFILSLFLCLYSILNLIKIIFDENKNLKFKNIFFTLILFLISLFLIDLFREYYLKLILLFKSSSLILIIIISIFKYKKNISKILINSITCILFLFSYELIIYTKNNIAIPSFLNSLNQQNNLAIKNLNEDNDSKYENIIEKEVNENEMTDKINKNNDNKKQNNLIENESNNIQSNILNDLEIKKVSGWQKVWYLPNKIDQLVYDISRSREGFNNIELFSRTSIDTNINFKNSSEFFNYFPRATQIGLFAPFPNMWFSDDYNNDNRSNLNLLLKFISSFEMIILYLIYLLFLFSLQFIYKNIYYFLSLIFAFQGLLIFSYIVTNIGNLIRMRYGFLILIVSLCILSILKNLNYKNKISQ